MTKREKEALAFSHLVMECEGWELLRFAVEDTSEHKRIEITLRDPKDGCVRSFIADWDKPVLGYDEHVPF